MKKLIARLFILVLLCGAALGSCKPKQSCPAYGKTAVKHQGSRV